MVRMVRMYRFLMNVLKSHFISVIFWSYQLYFVIQRVLGLKRWLASQKHLSCLQKIQIEYPQSTWQVRTIVHSISRESNTVFCLPSIASRHARVAICITQTKHSYIENKVDTLSKKVLKISVGIFCVLCSYSKYSFSFMTFYFSSNFVESLICTSKHSYTAYLNWI